GLFPRDWCDLHELQGGEQKTHEVYLAFAADAVSSPPLAWTHDRTVCVPSADTVTRSGALPYFVAEPDDPNHQYRDLVSVGLSTATGFEHKREQADEYGWRNFGDLPADHEAAFVDEGDRLVSHYNNQYDAMAGFAIQCLRSGDRRWWDLFVDLARHVRDI